MYNNTDGHTPYMVIIKIEEMLKVQNKLDNLQFLDFEKSETISLNRDEFCSHFLVIVPTKNKEKQYVFSGWETMTKNINISNSFTIKDIEKKSLQ
jgi:hypothetical protein